MEQRGGERDRMGREKRISDRGRSEDRKMETGNDYVFRICMSKC